MKQIFLVLFGGGLGAVLRHLVNVGVTRSVLLRFPELPTFPFGVMVINITGSFVMGLAAAALAVRSSGLAQDVRLFFATGVLGGYTTFSSFSLDTAHLIERGDLGLAFVYVAGSVFVSILALFAGLWTMRALL